MLLAGAQDGGLSSPSPGGVIIFLEAIGYLTIGGNAVAGGLGILFAIVTTIFGWRGYLATDKKDKTINGMIPMLIGFVVMAAGGSLLIDIVVILGGFLMTMGGILITSGK